MTSSTSTVAKIRDAARAEWSGTTLADRLNEADRHEFLMELKVIEMRADLWKMLEHVKLMERFMRRI